MKCKGKTLKLWRIDIESVESSKYTFESFGGCFRIWTAEWSCPVRHLSLWCTFGCYSNTPSPQWQAYKKCYKKWKSSYSIKILYVLDIFYVNGHKLRKCTGFEKNYRSSYTEIREQNSPYWDSIASHRWPGQFHRTHRWPCMFNTWPPVGKVRRQIIQNSIHGHWCSTGGTNLATNGYGKFLEKKTNLSHEMTRRRQDRLSNNV